MSKMDEEIIAVNRKVLFGEDDSNSFQGFLSYEKSPNLSESLLEIMFSENKLGRRGDYEEDPSYKQPIPYTVLVGTDSANPMVYTYQRLTGGGEVRLHNKLSVGVGGHMNLLFDYSTLYDEAVRELDEELYIDADSCRYKVLGLINDDSTPVSSVHIGILIKAIVPPHVHVEVRETDQLKGEWISLSDLLDSSTYDRLESWSQIAVNHLAETYFNHK